VTQLGSTAVGTGHEQSSAVRGSRLARRRRVLLGVGIAAALLAVGGLIGASFVKSPQQLAADTAAPPATVTTATVVSQILTASVQMRGEVYPATQYDVYASAPSSGSAAGVGGSGGSSGSAVYISKLDVAAGDTISNGEQLAEIDGQPMFALAGPVPAWRDLTPGETGPDVAELQDALSALGYYDEGDTPGYYGPATEYAVQEYYQHLGCTPPSSGGVPSSSAVFIPLAVHPSTPLPAALNGENVLVTVQTGQTEGPVLTVPAAAIVATASGTSYVTVVGAHGKQTQVPVTPGISENGYVQVTPVTSGALAAGDHVAVSG
jgi:peptidoglycan hydrolase-like protein with peptidoglycan-binding domain